MFSPTCLQRDFFEPPHVSVAGRRPLLPVLFHSCHSPRIVEQSVTGRSRLEFQQHIMQDMNALK